MSLQAVVLDLLAVVFDSWMGSLGPIAELIPALS